MANKTNSCIKYTGSIKVTYKNARNKTIYTHTYHNNGNYYLWEFLAKCISGNLVNDLLPTYVRLFNCSESSPTSTTTIGENSTAMSNYINKTTLSWKKTNDNIDGVTLHFVIPSAFVYSPDKTKINQAGLYCSTAVSEENGYTNFSAAFNFTKSDSTSSTGLAWQPIEINANSNYNIYIEWTMSFSN